MYFAIKNPIDSESVPKNSIGTAPWLPSGIRSPVCAQCSTSMQLFFQFDIDRRFNLPLQEGSHFVLFMCPECNEIPSFESYSGKQLPERFWEKTEGHFFSALYKPQNLLVENNISSLLKSYKLDFHQINSVKMPNELIKVGGKPDWLQDDERFFCCCGEEMSFICQVPENYPFPKTDSAPEQPDSFSGSDYCIFLGNQVYIFGCSKQCHERAIWITVQN